MEDHIHQSNLIEGYNNAQADELSIAAWEWLSAKTEITEDVIRKLQKRITLFQTDLRPDWRGYYRKIPVWIGGMRAIPPGLVPGQMKKWIARLRNANLLVDPIELHIEFERIHPFVDGNGRTGRMLL